MKLLSVLTVFALCGYCVGVPATETGGGTTHSDSDFVTSSPSVMQKSTSAFTCYARVKVSTSCNSIVLLQTILLRPLDSTTRYLIDPKGEAEKSYVCATVPCDANGHLTVGAILLAESKGDESVTVEPHNLDRNSKNLYQNMDLCIAGKSGNTATATCKETTSDSVTMVLKEELDSLLSKDQQTESIEQQQDSKDTEPEESEVTLSTDQGLQLHDEEETAQVQWQNDWDRPLNVRCRNNQAFYRVRSYHDNGREDRRWLWYCRTVLRNTRFTNCQLTGWQNDYDQPLMFQCPTNKVLTGVESVHDNGREDRRWKFQCCGANGYYTRNCYLTNWINNWDASMDHAVPSPRVLTGAYSYHDNGREDRRWKIMVCDYVYCSV